MDLNGQKCYVIINKCKDSKRSYFAKRNKNARNIFKHFGRPHLTFPLLK